MVKKEFQIAYSELLNSNFFQICTQEQQLYMITLFLRAHQNDLPVFPSNQLVFDDDINDALTFDGVCYSAEAQRIEHSYNADVPPTDCIGYVWLFRNDHTYGRPVPERLSKCLYLPPDTAPPIFVEEMGDKWYCSDGCHRIYAAYLLDRTVHVCVDGKHIRQP